MTHSAQLTLDRQRSLTPGPEVGGAIGLSMTGGYGAARLAVAFGRGGLPRAGAAWAGSTGSGILGDCTNAAGNGQACTASDIAQMLALDALTGSTGAALRRCVLRFADDAAKAGVEAAEDAVPTLRTDIQLSGGRGGGAVKTLTGPPNSIVRGASGRIFRTDSEGRVISDITAGRVKPVTPGGGFGPKRPPTPQELEWLRRAWGG